MEKKHTLNLVLNEIKKSDDPTIIPCTYVIMDFEKSLNNVIVSKDVALEASKTLINKPIVAKYHKVSEYNTETDNFGGHEEHLSKDRNGNDFLERDTVPMGVFTSEGYLKTLMINGVAKEVLVADAVMWYSKFKDACDLLIELYKKNVKINMSCEYLYHNYNFIDGVEHHQSPIIFESHAILASEDRGVHEKVLPAYDSATLLSFNEINRFERLVAQALDQDKKGGRKVEEEIKKEITEPEVKEKTPLNEISLYEVGNLIRENIEKSLGKDEHCWVTDIYKETVIVAVETEHKYTHYEFNYSLSEDDVVVDLTSKKEVKEKREWIEVTNLLEELIIELKKAKEEIEEKFNSALETILDLNSQLQELTPIKEKYFQAKRAEKLVASQEKYEAKFKALNAMDKYESEEVQSLINATIEDGEVGKEAVLKLNEMLVDLVSETVIHSVEPVITLN
ncbi:hypothetical protein ACFVRU_55430, partial [Streptomyces sp. NPDC057927]